VTTPVTPMPAGRAVYGPYDTDMDTYNEPMPREWRTLHDSRRVGFGDPDRIARDAKLQALLTACHGVEIGAYDARILRWLTDVGDPPTVQAVIGVISRVAAVARREAGEETARALEQPPAMSNQEIVALTRADGDENRSMAVVQVALGYAAGVARRVSAP